MHEVIITYVVPEVDDEPASTEVYRFEFEDAPPIKASLAWLQSQAVDGGQLFNKEAA